MKVREEKGIKKVFDPIRKKYIILTPEEYVRQHLLNFLINHKGFPIGLIAVEQLVVVNTLQQRADIIAYTNKGRPLLIVECKASSVELTQQTFAQAARYNLSLRAPYLLVSNGINHFCSKLNLDLGSFELLDELPEYMSIGRE